MKAAEFDVETDNLKEAGKKIHQAMKIANSLGNGEILGQINEFIQRFTYSVETQPIELSSIETDGFILDLGGGGEGIISKLNGNQVVAIDKSKRELEETQNEALKIVMDATNLKFLSQSFDFCTSFFSLMYIPKNNHPKVFKEVHRVLKDNGSFLLWDATIPKRLGDFKAFMVRLKVTLPHEKIETGYGVEWQEQNIAYFKELAKKTRFKIANERSKGEIFHLELSKE